MTTVRVDRVVSWPIGGFLGVGQEGRLQLLRCAVLCQKRHLGLLQS